MSHVDDGTLHAYLDGELAPAEARGVDAHLAQCPGCRERLEEERALITRAGELLALAAPPDRELPPFRAGDVKPAARLWWQVRQPLAWAATIVLALGIGTYLGRGFEELREPETAPDAEPVRPQALETPLTSERAQRESRVKVTGAVRKQTAAQPAGPAPAAANRADYVAQRAEASSAQSAPNAAPAPQAGFMSPEGEHDMLRGPLISIDTARALLGRDPLALPGAPIRAVYRARQPGYSAVVIVEQSLDSGTVIEVVNKRASPMALDAVVVSAAPAAQADSMRAPERAPEAGQRATDSLAALNRRRAALPLASAKAADRPSSGLFLEVRGPLSQDSLATLYRLLQPLRP